MQKSLGTFKSVEAAWRAANSAVLNSGEWSASVVDETSIGSGFGERERPFKELSACSFEIDNPRDREIVSHVRPLNTAFLLANFIWTISGSNQLAMIASYNDRGRCFSDDGVTLASAFGPRLFGKNGRQFDRVADLICRDNSTRRAVVNLFDERTIENHSRDVSCALAMQFLVRAGKLNCIVYMRSQSAAMVMPYDLFLFTMLHEAMATRLNISLGTYTHVCSSLHYYSDEEKTVRAIVAEEQSLRHRTARMSGFSEATRLDIVALEKALRKSVAAGCELKRHDVESALNNSSTDAYWKNLILTYFDNHVCGVRNKQGAVHSSKKNAK